MKSKNTETTEMCGGNVTAAEQEEPSAAETVEKENREYKNSVFVDLFYDDETAEKICSAFITLCMIPITKARR